MQRSPAERGASEGTSGLDTQWSCSCLVLTESQE